MQRQRGELVPIGEVIADLPGPVQAIRKATPQALHHFTRFDQVNQLVTASEADPERGFMARMMALCSLPRTNPGDRIRYKRVNGPYTLYMTAGGGCKLPYGNLGFEPQPPPLVASLAFNRSGADSTPRVGSRKVAIGFHANARYIQQRRQAPNPGSVTK